MTPVPAANVVEILMRHRERFLKFLAPRVGGREAAEDFLQGALLKSIHKGASVRAEESVVAWFYRVLRNAVIDHYRDRAAEARSLEALAREAGPGVFEAELESAVCECITGLLPTLKPEYAEVLRRVDMEDGSLAATARAMGVTPNNAGVRLHRARAALRKRLEEACGACAQHGCLDCGCARSNRPS